MPATRTGRPRSWADIAAEREQARADLSDLMGKSEALTRSAAGHMTDGQLEQASRYATGIDRARGRIDALNDEFRAALADGLADGRLAAEGPFVPADQRSPAVAAGPEGQLRAAASRTIDRLHSAGSLPDYGAERATALLSAGTPYDRSLAARWATSAGDPAYLTAFQKLLGDPTTGHLLFDARELEAYRSVVNVGNEMRAAGLTIAGGSGGYMVPLTLDPAVILNSAGTTNALRKVARVVQTMTNTWQGVTSAGVSAEWLSTEATQVAEATPTLVSVPIPVILGDAYLHASFQVVDDAANFQAEMSKILLDAADTLMATAYTTGAGTTEPKGIITALSGGASKVDAAGEAIVAADVLGLQAVLDARWQPRAQWMAHLGILAKLAALETTAGALRFPELANGRLLNRPVVENSDMDATINAAASEVNYSLLYGDFTEFIIADRIGARLEVIPNVVGANQRPTAERGFLLWFRTGSDVATIKAFRLLKVTTTA